MPDKVICYDEGRHLNAQGAAYMALCGRITYSQSLRPVAVNCPECRSHPDFPPPIHEELDLPDDMANRFSSLGPAFGPPFTKCGSMSRRVTRDSDQISCPRCIKGVKIGLR